MYFNYDEKYYSCSLSTKPVKPNTTIQVACEMQGGNVRPVPLICGSNHNQSLVIGYSLDVGMIFETIVSFCTLLII